MAWILRLIFLVVLLSVLYSVLPESRLKSILGGIAGIMLMLSFVQPIGQFVQSKQWFDLDDLDINATLDNSAESQNQILTQYKHQCLEAIIAYVEGMDSVEDCRGEILVDENWGTDTFGQIQHVYLYVSFGEEKDNDSWIPPIIIFPQTESSKKEHLDQLKAIQSSVSAWLQIDLDCITVFEEASYG
ncbi:MAG: stage III sporulation protein AF [Clostridia bacterium]|nr:stage III sporulation protein AF [Clostridia bacterium]